MELPCLVPWPVAVEIPLLDWTQELHSLVQTVQDALGYSVHPQMWV